MRPLLISVMLLLAFNRVDASQDARPVDPALIQRFIDADTATRRELSALPEVGALEFRIKLQESGALHSRQGRTKEAVRVYEAAIELAALVDAPRTRIGAMISLGMVYGTGGDYAEAIRQLSAALAEAQPDRDDDLIAAAANNLGNIYRRRGEHDKALKTYQQALASNEAAKREVQIARTLNNIGLVYEQQGDFQHAIEYYLRSLALKERLGPPDEVISTLGNIGSVYQLQGNNSQAIVYVERGLALAEQSHNVRLMIGTLGNIGRSMIQARRYAEAEVRLKRALQLAEDAGYSEQRAATLTVLGDLETARRQWIKAGDYLSRARAIYGAIGDPPGVGQVLLSLARIEIDRGRAAGGLALAQQTRDMLASVGRPTALIDAEVLYGEALTSLGRWDDAIATFERAIGLTERGLDQVAGAAEDRLRFLESSTNAYFGLVHAYASTGRASDALAAAERGRARTLLDMLVAQRPGEDELSDAERERRIELDTALTALNERVATEQQRAGTPNPTLAAERERLRRSRDEFYLGLDARHPRLRFARGGAPVLTGPELAATLPAQSALVEFVVGPHGAWVLALIPRAGRAPRLLARPATLSPSRLRGLAATFARQVATRDLSFSANAHALYNALLGPIDAELIGIERLVVVPHGGLWEVPFQALQTPRQKYLIEEHALAYAPSASTLKELELRQKPRTAQPRVVAFGDPRLTDKTLAPLPQAAREAHEVAELYGETATVATDAEASEGRFRQLAPRADILHIATHGVFDNAGPLFSYVILAGSGAGTANDGRLEGHELINLQLKADLVVLSACETARGRISNGEGVVGLSWALFAAGASTTIVSLWPVDSTSTTDLMSAFHRERRRLTAAAAVAPNAEALRAAQLQALARPESRHPFYWAGFVAIGVP